MEYYPLGNTGLRVSALCFGTLPMGPLQAGLSAEEGGALILEGLERGINFIDTAEIYGTYEHIRWALKRFSGPVVVASKSTAQSYQSMKDSVERCLNELGRDQIEIFHLHAARDNNPLVERAEALEALLEYKTKGIIKAVGLANHSVLGVGRSYGDPRLDIIFALINRTGMGVLDGNTGDMAKVLANVTTSAKGLYAMKALAGGNLLEDIPRNLAYVRDTVGIPVVAVGMIRRTELEMNLALFQGETISETLLNASKQFRKKAKVTFLCKGCGRCVSYCHNHALSIVDGRAVIDEEQCLLCGYCSRECPQFAIRVI